MNFIKLAFFFSLIFGLLITEGCNRDGESGEENFLYTHIQPENSGVDFVNQLDYVEEFNIYRYRNFYNGGGVGLGDINNDGLIDIYFISNMHENRLYLNKGDFKFEDITDITGTGGTQAWSTGVSLADINGDGWLDIYVCNSGNIDGDKRQNELFINNGALPNGEPSLTFTESAEKYGLADRGLSIHAAFFDYDRDNDLDVYILNNSHQAIGSFDLSKNQRNERDTIAGDKLMRNDGDHFTDVSEEAGIFSSIIGFGLGVTVGDINLDGWLDIYISNDFFERDYIYMNNQDGTFTEKLTEMMRSTSAASMGADMGDINNDCYPEIFVTDMIPESDARLKTKTTFDSWENYDKNVQNGYHHQFTRNMFHLNNTDGTFSEIGRLAGVYATDWSWGALIFDMDNDGLKDLFVANGIYQDLTDQDYIQHFSDMRMVRSIIAGNNVDFKKLIDAIPSVKLSNFAFRNEGNLKFNNQAKEWGLDMPSHSNGSAYGDLDNDGDYDLVVNNANMPAFIYRNESGDRTNGNKFLKFNLHGMGRNTHAIGTKIFVFCGEVSRCIEQVPVRGFQSTVDHNPVLGLGKVDMVDSILVEWPDGKITRLTNVPVNQTLELIESEAGNLMTSFPKRSNHEPLFAELSPNGFDSYKHIENDFNDFERDKLLIRMLSVEGPGSAVADVNNDGLDDIYLGGAKNQAGALFLQTASGSFSQISSKLFESDALCEDTDAVFFDADGDADLDLYVASGGSEYSSSSSGLIDRLYINEGRGNFRKSDQMLPAGKFESTSCVKAADYDNDGIMELFVGIRSIPFYYGVPTNGYILENDGKGTFSNITNEVAPGLEEIGMITDMAWEDLDGDGDLDIFISGDWMPLTVFINDNGQFVNRTEEAGLSLTQGWWNTLKPSDLDNDGDIDFIAGNHGLNSRFKATATRPVTMYVNDFDLNGRVEQVICYYEGDTSYPIALKHDIDNQIPFLKKKYPQYVDYMGQTIQDMFTPDQLERAIELKSVTMSSAVVRNLGDGTFRVEPLPLRSQFSSIFAVHIEDLNEDGIMDIITGGNYYKVKPEIGRDDASYGEIFLGQPDGSYAYIPPGQSGLLLKEQIRGINVLRSSKGRLMVVARNDLAPQVFRFLEK